MDRAARVELEQERAKKQAARTALVARVVRAALDDQLTTAELGERFSLSVGTVSHILSVQRVRRGRGPDARWKRNA